MKQLKVRFGRSEDIVEIVKWLNGNPQNEYNSRILSYPTLQVLTAYEDNGPNVCHLPIHRVLMLESIARNPQASDMNVAQALRDLTKASELVADSHGVKEMYFLDGGGRVGDLAASVKNHSFEELDYKVFRCSLK